jgi:putative membrane protein
MTTRHGAAFDKAYITAPLANHEFLRDHAETYLANSQGHTSMAEMHGCHLAMPSLAAFKEHVIHTKNIPGDLKAA